MKISVLTVTYCAEQLIERTLQSVAQQQLTDGAGTYTAQHSEGRGLEVEHWVIDGASKDNTMQLVAAYANVSSLSEPDNGIYDAMNKGLQLATGHYVVFLNAGDKLHDQHTLQRVFNIACGLDANGLTRADAHILPAVIYGQTEWVDAQGNFVDMRNHWAPEHLTTDSFKHGMMVCHQSFYARIDLARATPYNLHYRYSADYDWCIRIMRQAEKRKERMINTQFILTSYLSEGMTTQNHAASLRERMLIMAHYYGWLPTALRHLGKVLKQLR